MLGYLDAGFFLGGKMKLDKAAAETAIAEGVGKPLKLETLRAAWGIHDIISEDVARAFRMHATERGFDYRSGSMVALRRLRARCMRCRSRASSRSRAWCFPVGAGVMSALGLLVSPLAFEVARSRRIHVDDIDADDVRGDLRRAREPKRPAILTRGRRGGRRHPHRAPSRHALPGPGPRDRGDAAGRRTIAAALVRRARRAVRPQPTSKAYSLRLDEPIEIVNWKVEAVGPTPSLGEGYSAAGAGAAERALKGTRSLRSQRAAGSPTGRSTTATRWRPAQSSRARR